MALIGNFRGRYLDLGCERAYARSHPKSSTLFISPLLGGKSLLKCDGTNAGYPNESKTERLV